MEGLDATVLSLSEVRADNEKLRIDDGYFSKLAVSTQQRIEKLPHVRLGEACATFRKGIFDIKAESYVDEGVPFIHIGDLKGGLINDSNLSFITEDTHFKEAATALVFGDVVLSKTAYAAASLVNVPRCNVCQDTIAVQIEASWRKKLLTGYLVTFLNTKHGLALLERQFQGNVQAHLSLPDGRKVPVPLFGEEFQKSVHDTLLKADALQVKARETITEAEQTLLRALGMEDWEPPEPLTYTRRASEVLPQNRLDSEYYRPRFDALRSKLAQKHKTMCLGEMGAVMKGWSVPYSEDGVIPIIRSGDLSDISQDERFLRAAETEDVFTLARGDVLVSSIGFGSIGKVQMFDKAGRYGTVSEVTVIRQKQVRPYYLTAFLRSRAGQMQIEQFITGATGQLHLYPRDVARIEVPLVNDAIQNDLEMLATQSAIARQEAQALLAKAKRAVEVANEEGEEKARAYLSSIPSGPIV